MGSGVGFCVGAAQTQSVHASLKMTEFSLEAYDRDAFDSEEISQQSTALNELAPRNMSCKSVTLLVSHADRF